MYDEFYDKKLEKLTNKLVSRNVNLNEIKYIEDLFQKDMRTPYDMINKISKLRKTKLKSLLYQKGNKYIPIDLDYLQDIADNYYEYCEDTSYAEWIANYPQAYMYNNLKLNLDYAISNNLI